MKRLVGQTSGHGTLVVGDEETRTFYEATLWENVQRSSRVRSVEGKLTALFPMLVSAMTGGLSCRLRLKNGDEADIVVNRANPQGGSFHSTGPFPWPSAV